MKVLGIGNAIVDVICKVQDKFLEENVFMSSMFFSKPDLN